MWVIYRKSDHKVVGVSADSDVELDQEVAVQETLRALPDPGKRADYDALQITERGWLFRMGHAVGSGRAAVRPGKSGELEVVDETPETAMLLVTTDAKEFHPVDGAALIAGDGKSFVTLHLAKVDERGKPLERKKDADSLWLRTDHGSLRDGSGEKEIRSVKLASGKAAFRLYSEKARRLATVHIFNADQYLRDTAVRVEFT